MTSIREISLPTSILSAKRINHIPQWYVLRTKARHEKLVRDRLELQGIEPLLPTVRRISQWKDRKKEIEVPLFSCYCFVRFAEINWNVVRMVTGVIEIIGSGRQPEPVPEVEIASLKKLMTNVLPYDPCPFLHEGMQVEVVRGPLKGISGILLRKEKAYRLVLGFKLIQQAVAVEIDVDDVAPF